MTLSAASPLSMLDLAVATTLVVAAGLVSLLFRIGLEKRLAIAAARTFIQLLAVGYLLRWVFQASTAWVLVAAFGLMIAAAAREAVRRSSRRYRGAYLQAFVTLLLVGTLTTGIVTQIVIGVSPWYHPQYLIPLLGMVLGNSLTGISLCLDELLEMLDERRDRIEMCLALGATSWEAVREPLREAVRRGMIPIINAMTVAGIVSLPGMMTGQILAGSDPLLAVAYQIVVMFMLAASTTLGCIATALWVHRQLFSANHQLMHERILKTEQ